MTYNASEISVKQGQPVELHRWAERTNGGIYTLTSAAYEITYNDEIYTPEPGLVRSEIRDDEDFLKAELTVRVSYKNVLSSRFMLASVDDIIDYICYRAHGTDYDTYWRGVLKGVSPIDSDDMAVIKMGPVSEELAHPSLVMRYMRPCGVPLYSTPCGMDPDDYKITGTLSSVSGKTVKANNFATVSSGWLTGGWLNANGYRRKIDSHSGDTITIMSAIPNLAAGMSYSAYAGCNKSLTVCDTKFHNSVNHRGCRWIPDNEPFTQRVL